jgi:tripartite-type tricarboxylate transporter receptor subunit TctC
MVFPAGIPQDITDRWYRNIVQIVALPEMRKRLAAMSFEPVTSSPEDFSALIKSEIQKWRKVIDRANIKKLDQ